MNGIGSKRRETMTFGDGHVSLLKDKVYIFVYLNINKLTNQMLMKDKGSKDE